MIHVSMAASFIYWTIGSKYFLWIYIFVYLCIYLFIYLFTFLHVYIFLYICVLMYLLIHLSIYIFTCLYIFIHLCIYLFSYILYVYIYFYIFMYSFYISMYVQFLWLSLAGHILAVWFANFEGTVQQGWFRQACLSHRSICLAWDSQSVIHLQTIQRCVWFFSQGPGVITSPYVWFLHTWRLWH
jgi:hypothetical protein